MFRRLDLVRAGGQVGGQQVMVGMQVRRLLPATHQRSNIHVHVTVLRQTLHDVVVHLQPEAPPLIHRSRTLCLASPARTAL